jgi:transposase InsO family protein
MEIVGRSMSERLESALREDALKMAIRNRRFTSGLIVHSDRGMRHARNIYSELLSLNNITDPMIRNVNYMNNASIKRYFISLKTEMVHRTNFRTRRNARAALCECIELFYSRQRRHLSNGYRTLAQARTDMLTKMAV